MYLLTLLLWAYLHAPPIFDRSKHPVPVHIAVFCQHYHTPDCPTAGRPYALVCALAAHHDVTLITANMGRKRRITNDYSWVPPGVALHEVSVSYQNEMNAARRLLSFGRYAAQAALKGLAAGAPDIVLASSTPLTVPMVGALVARWYGVPWLFEVRDLWPDFPIQMGAVPAAGAQRALYALERYLYCNARHVVALSPDMASHVRRRSGHNRVSMNPYGTDLSLLRHAPIREAEALCPLKDEQRLVLYAGSFGRANALPTLLDAAHRLRHRSDIVWAFVGSGYHQPDIEAAARRLSNVRLLPPQPYPRTLALFKHATLSVTSFIDRPVLRANAPSKLMDSLAAGTPVIVTNPGWTKELVASGRCGWYVPPQTPENLAACVCQYMEQPSHIRARWSRNAIHLAHTRFDRAGHMQAYRQLIENLV